MLPLIGAGILDISVVAIIAKMTEETQVEKLVRRLAEKKTKKQWKKDAPARAKKAKT